MSGYRRAGSCRVRGVRRTPMSPRRPCRLPAQVRRHCQWRSTPRGNARGRTQHQGRAGWSECPVRLVHPRGPTHQLGHHQRERFNKPRQSPPAEHGAHSVPSHPRRGEVSRQIDLHRPRLTCRFRIRGSCCCYAQPSPTEARSWTCSRSVTGLDVAQPSLVGQRDRLLCDGPVPVPCIPPWGRRRGQHRHPLLRQGKASPPRAPSRTRSSSVEWVGAMTLDL